MMVLIVFNLIDPTGWQVGLIRIEDIVVGVRSGCWYRCCCGRAGRATRCRRPIDAAFGVGTQYLRAAVRGSPTARRAPPTVDELGHRALTASRTVDDAVRQYLSESGGTADHRAPVVRGPTGRSACGPRRT